MKFWNSFAFLEPEQLLDMARISDETGFHGIALSDHLFYPKQRTVDYPYTADGAPMWQPETAWPDPFTAIGAMAAVTEQVRFTTNVYVAPVRDLFTVAKQVSTAAVLSQGRVTLGVAAGWSKDEFDQTGQEFTNRGKRLNEMIPALRELWSDGWCEYHGTFYDFDALTLEPTPPGPVPIYVGGDSMPALRRAATLGDGWIGIGYKPDDAEERIGQLRRLLAETGRENDDFEIILALYAQPSLDLYGRFVDLGVTGFTWSPWMLADVNDDRFASPFEARVAATEEFAEKYIEPLA